MSEGGHASYLIGIDVGGTFTDLVALDDGGGLTSAKTPSIRARQEEGVLRGLELLAQRCGLSRAELLGRTGLIVHGTTMATNALLELRGARTGLVTTEGFRDELEFRRGYKESVFDIRLSAPPLLVPRARRHTVPERINADGAVALALDEAAVRDVARRLREQGAGAVAVGLLFSFLDDRHERRVAEILRAELPAAFVTASCDVLPQIREYERISTTVVNAYVSPELRRYLERLGDGLGDAGFAGELLIIQSNGGVLGPAESAERGVQTLLSGPAGGIAAAGDLGDRLGQPNLLTADMGGTSYDVGVVSGGAAEITTGAWINRQRIALPMLDIHTIGAGGGSIGWVDEGMSLRIGPESAGADPGPACYGQGGTRPTITDADLLLGYIDPDYFLGGAIRLNADAAAEAVATHVAEPLGLSVEDAAAMMFEVANGAMANAIRYVTAERGVPPEDFALVAMGGAGGIHAGRQAEELDMSLVIVPAGSAFFCALGCALANLRASSVQTFIAPADALDRDALNRAFGEMEREARARLGDALALAEEVRLERYLDLRYTGEVHELSVPIRSRSRRVTELNLRAALASFHELHEQRYAHHDRSQPIEVLGLRLELLGALPRPRPRLEQLGSEDPTAALTGSRAVYVPQSGQRVDAPVYDAEALAPGALIEGPAVIQRPDTTIVVYPQQEAMIDGYRNFLIELAGAPAAGTGTELTTAGAA